MCRRLRWDWDEMIGRRWHVFGVVLFHGLLVV